MKYRGIFEYEYPTEHKPPVSIDVHLHGDCVKGKIIEWEYRPLGQEPKTGRWINGDDKCPCCGKSKFEGLDADIWADWQPNFCSNCGARMVEPQESEKA